MTEGVTPLADLADDELRAWGVDPGAVPTDRRPGGTRRFVDPSGGGLSESGLTEKALCDYVVNVAAGCNHGCQFCYVPDTLPYRMDPGDKLAAADVDDPQGEWGNYVVYRAGIGARVAEETDQLLSSNSRTWTTSEAGRGIVGVSFGTDCFMDRFAGRLTVDVIQALADRDRYVRVLTRNPVLASSFMDTFEAAGEYVTVGSSINSLQASELGAIEPNAPPPQARLRGLEQFADAGVRTFVSMSPTYPTMDRSDLRALLERIAEVDPDVVYHEPINPRGGNFQQTVEAAWAAGEDDLAGELVRLRESREAWMEYACRHFRWVQELADAMGVPVHLWPDDSLIELAENSGGREQAEWLRAWKQRESPEAFAERPEPGSSRPPIPETGWSVQSTLG